MALMIFLSSLFGILWCWHKRCLPPSDYPKIIPGRQSDAGSRAGTSYSLFEDSRNQDSVSMFDSVISSEPLYSSDNDHWQQDDDMLTNPIYSWNPANIHHSSDPAYAFEPGNIFHNTAMDPTWHDSSFDISCGTSGFDPFDSGCSCGFDDNDSLCGSSFASNDPWND